MRITITLKKDITSNMISTLMGKKVTGPNGKEMGEVVSIEYTTSPLFLEVTYEIYPHAERTFERLLRLEE